MSKSRSFIAFMAIGAWLLAGCQSIEQVSIDYLQPAELSFPPQLRKVAVVNNTSGVPDNKLTLQQKEEFDNNSLIVSRATAYSYGDPKAATESLAEELANQNYFDKVVICDSALRANDKLLRESTLSSEEVEELASDLGADFIIALENLQFKAVKSVRFLPDFNCYQGAMDVKVFPTIKIYIPGRNKPMTTLHPQDSIFWEDYGGSATSAMSQIIPDQEMLAEASNFAGTVPVKQLVPLWKTETRYIYTGGSVQMRDAAISVREESWDDAGRLWKQAFEGTKSSKKKMRAAYNMAVYYEMKDSLEQATKWAEKALQLSKDIDLKNLPENAHVAPEEVPHYYLASRYLSELKERNSQLPKLKMQMSRFEDDF